MSQLPRLKHAADVHHPNIERMNERNPDQVHFHEDSKDFSYNAKRHRRASEDEVIEILEISSSSAYSSEEEDEVRKYQRAGPSNIRGNRLYIRSGRRRAHDGSMHAPHAQADMMLTAISFVTTAVHVACLAEGKNFSLPPGNGRANSSFYYPLEGLKSDLQDLFAGIGSWSRRFRQMEWEELKLAQLIRTRRLTEEDKMGKVHRALRRTGDITDSYVYSFTTVANELRPVHLELKRLMFLLTCIIQEGNTLEMTGIEVDKEAIKLPEDVISNEDKALKEAELEGVQKEDNSTRDDDPATEANSVVIKEEEVVLEEGRETSKDPKPELLPQNLPANERGEAKTDAAPAVPSPETHEPDHKQAHEPSIDDSALDDLTDPFVTRPPTPRHPQTPTWKHALRHLNMANLYVGDIEIYIFKGVLALVREVQRNLVRVVRLCEDFGARAAEKQEVWNEWKEIIEGWNAKERGGDGERFMY
ncbi:MAG: hypothetical protein M1830_002389 [Pleopsidium flavum]|nr:MAG: hypothetical protein M1830_002389 [Pleopsidium flavum]